MIGSRIKDESGRESAGADYSLGDKLMLHKRIFNSSSSMHLFPSVSNNANADLSLALSLSLSWNSGGCGAPFMSCPRAEHQGYVRLDWLVRIFRLCENNNDVNGWCIPGQPIAQPQATASCLVSLIKNFKNNC